MGVKGQVAPNRIEYKKGDIIGDQCVYISEAPSLPKKRRVIVQCRCGKLFESLIGHIRFKGTISCGCVNEANKRTHNLSKSPEYKIWAGIKNRINEPKNPSYKDYGGRGIKLHPEWEHDFMAFLNYIGLRPSKNHSVDRIDVNGNYEPGNVKYSTDKEQANNRRNNNWLEYNGEIKTATQWADILDIKRYTIYFRVKQGWSIKDIKEFYNK